MTVNDGPGRDESQADDLLNRRFRRAAIWLGIIAGLAAIPIALPRIRTPRDLVLGAGAGLLAGSLAGAITLGIGEFALKYRRGTRFVRSYIAAACLCGICVLAYTALMGGLKGALFGLLLGGGTCLFILALGGGAAWLIRGFRLGKGYKRLGILLGMLTWLIASAVLQPKVSHIMRTDAFLPWIIFGPFWTAIIVWATTVLLGRFLTGRGRSREESIGLGATHPEPSNLSGRLSDRSMGDQAESELAMPHGGFLPLTVNGERLYVTFWERVWATFLDGFFLLPLVFLFLWLEGFNRNLGILILIFSSAFFTAYVLYFSVRFGGTLGPLALGLRIAKPDGTRIGWAEAWKWSAVGMALTLATISLQVWARAHVGSEQYAASAFAEKWRLVRSHYPSWSYVIEYTSWAWFLSRFIVLLANQRRRILEDFIAGTVWIHKEFLRVESGKPLRAEYIQH